MAEGITWFGQGSQPNRLAVPERENSNPEGVGPHGDTVAKEKVASGQISQRSQSALSRSGSSARGILGHWGVKFVAGAMVGAGAIFAAAGVGAVAGVPLMACGAFV